MDQPELRRVANGKVTHNLDIIRGNAEAIRNSLADLEKGLHSEHYETISKALKRITENAIGCRSRLQFIRGVLSLELSHNGGVSGKPAEDA
jgi:hypothetical protein